MEDDPDFQFTASTWMLGLLNALGYALGIPILFFSTQLIRLVGHENLLALGVLCYAGRFLGYSITYNPWLIYPTEALTAFTFLVFVLAPQFAMKTAPKYLATLNGLFGAANFGLGKCLFLTKSCKLLTERAGRSRTAQTRTCLQECFAL